MYSLEAELRQLPLSAARNLGLSDDWIERLEDSDPERRQILSVARTVAGTDTANYLEVGDLLLSIDGEPVAKPEEQPKQQQAPRRLEAKDLALNVSMIPLGSCTMKLNAAAEMIPITLPGFGKVHPFAPVSQAQGYARLFEELETWLAEITGFAGVSLG